MEDSKYHKRFDPDFADINNQNNREAAEERGLVYDSVQRAYVDCDGCLIRDEFGQEI
jgi:hypothetical protein